MSVEARESMSDAWTRWQGHVINGVYPLGRYLGGSDHSGVFLTKSTAPRASEVAIKLVPVNRSLAETLLPRWKRAGSLAQPHLLRVLEWGGCQLDGFPYLYAVMEYADQTLAQLLLHRAMTEDEAREMLPPILDALAFLHGRNLVQGQLKPANILVVGDQLKLASDTICRVNEVTPSTPRPTVYDPPEALRGSSSTAADIWALGISLFEALTRRPPARLGEHGDTIVLPADLPPAFREVVARCLSPEPQDRPTAMELAAWARGPSAGLAPTDPSPALLPAGPRTPDPVPPRVARTPGPVPPRVPPTQTAPEAPRTLRSMAVSSNPRFASAAVFAAVAILVLSWIGVHLLRTRPVSIAPASPARASRESPLQPSRESPLRAAGGAPSAPTEVRAPVSAESATTPDGSGVAPSPSALHEVIPEVPRSARRTIHGHIKVWVRVIVGEDGSVLSAVLDRAGPSRYFRRLAVEAARRWRFPPAETASQRMMEIRFDFSRDRTTGRAVTLH